MEKYIMDFLDNVYKELNDHIDKKEDIVVKEYGYKANKNGNPNRRYRIYMSELEFEYVVDAAYLNPDEILMFHDVLDRINKMRRENNYLVLGNQKEKTEELTEELEWDDVMYDDKQYETVYDYERDMFYELLKKINKKRKNRVV